MKNPELEQAMQDTLDGVATDAQAAWLKHRLETDPEAREEFARQEALFRRLAARPGVEPPAALAASVMSAIHAAPRRSSVKRDALASARGAFARRPALVGAWGFAIGCLVGAVLMLARTGAPWNAASRPLPVSATMGAAHPEGVVTDRASWRAGHAAGVLDIERHQDSALAHVSARSDFPADVVLEFDPAAMTPVGIDWSDRSGHALEIEAAGRIRFSSAGETETIVRFHCAEGADAALSVAVACGGANTRAVVHGGTGAPLQNESKKSVH